MDLITVKVIGQAYTEGQGPHHPLSVPVLLSVCIRLDAAAVLLYAPPCARAGERALERAGERALERAGERALERAGWYSCRY